MALITCKSCGGQISDKACFTGDYLAGNVPPKTDYSIYNSFQSFPSMTGTFSTMTDWEVVSLDYASGGQLSLF